MPLPEIVTPEFQTTLPSTGEQIFFRPFLVKEEKMLLMAQEGKDKSEITNAVIKILDACIKTPLEIRDLPIFDVEWLFLQLRSKSVNEVIDLNLRHTVEGCRHLNKIQLPIQDIEVKTNKDHSNILMISDETGLGMTLKYPSLSLTEKIDVDSQNNSDIFKLITICIKNIFDKQNVYNDYTKEELDKFIGDLPQDFLQKFMNFFRTMPRIGHKLEYKCEGCGKTVTHNLSGLMDFFL